MASYKPENDLEILLVDAATDASKRPAFYRNFLEATLLVAHDDESRPVSLPAARRQPSFRMLDIDGVPHCPVYTSAKRAAAQGHSEGYFHQVKTRALLESLRNVPFILNPGSIPSKVFSCAEIAGLLDGSLLSGDE